MEQRRVNKTSQQYEESIGRKAIKNKDITRIIDIWIFIDMGIKFTTNRLIINGIDWYAEESSWRWIERFIRWSCF